MLKESKKANILFLRSELLRALREFFYHDNFIEVTTPIRIASLAPETHIKPELSGSFYLRTSPEFQMKRLLQRGMERIFQIGPCFRCDEYGNKHRPEFTMLEWYINGANYRDILRHTQRLLTYVVERISSVKAYNSPIDFSLPWQEMNVGQAYKTYAGLPIDQVLKEDLFDVLMVEKIESQLGDHKPTILIDYPLEQGAFASQKVADPTVTERWELYISGLEIANACSEITNPEEQRIRFESALQDKTDNQRVDWEFIEEMGKGMSKCAGCALGIDRLLMILTGSTTIEDVLFT